MIGRFFERIKEASHSVMQSIRSIDWHQAFQPRQGKVRYSYTESMHRDAAKAARQQAEKFADDHGQLLDDTRRELSEARGGSERMGQERRQLVNESLTALMRHQFGLGEHFNPEAFNTLVQQRTGHGLTVGGVPIYDDATTIPRLAQALEELDDDYRQQGRRLSLTDIIRVHGKTRHGGDQERLEHTRHQIALHTLIASHYGEDFAQRAMREIEDPKAALRLAESWLPAQPKLTADLQRQLDTQRPRLVNLYEKAFGSRPQDQLLRELKSPGMTTLKRHAVPLALAAAIVAGMYGKLQPSMQYNWDNFVRPGLHWGLSTKPEPTPTPSPARPKPTQTPKRPATPTPAPSSTVPAANDLFMQEAATAIQRGPTSVLNITDQNTGINHQVALAALSEYEAEREGSLNLTDLRKALRSRHVNLLAAKEKGVKQGKVAWSNREKTEAPVYPNLKYVLERLGYRGSALHAIMQKYAERMRQLPENQGGWKPGKAPQGTVNTGPVTSGHWFRKFSRALARRKST